MEKLHKKKFVLALIILVSLLLVVGVISMLQERDLKDTEENNVKIETEKDNDSKDDNVAGLDAIEEDDGTQKDRTDASGSWEDDEEDTDTKNIGKTDTSGNNSNNKDNEASEDEIFVDEKSWGEIY